MTLHPSGPCGRVHLALLDPPPAGFPQCRSCAYLVTGAPATCFACATAGGPPPAERTCEVCDEPLVGDQPCRNTVCRFDDREVSRIYAVTERSEDAWDAICRYKYDEDQRWAEVLARLVVGYLDDQREQMRRFDLVTTGALYVGPRAKRLWDHLRLIQDAAREHGPQWPFADDLIVKSAPSGRFLGIGVHERQQIAEGELRSVLSVPEPERVAGRRVLVLDDVYSEGFSLREMARVLRLAGATEVAGLVFARRKGG